MEASFCDVLRLNHIAVSKHKHTPNTFDVILGILYISTYDVIVTREQVKIARCRLLSRYLTSQSLSQRKRRRTHIFSSNYLQQTVTFDLLLQNMHVKLNISRIRMIIYDHSPLNRGGHLTSWHEPYLKPGDDKHKTADTVLYMLFHLICRYCFTFPIHF